MTAFPYPEIDASLNAASAVFLLAGYICIRRRAIRAHVACMIAAVVCSTVFLGFYLTYHFMVHGISHFPHVALRPTYLTILLSHTLLAVGVLPLVIVTLNRALRRRWSRHMKIARWTLPVWLYVSITGVIVYWMLYHLAPTLRAVTASR